MHYLVFLTRLIFLPSPWQFLFVFMMNMLIGSYLTDECAEIIMAFLNVALTLAGQIYRFPSKLITFRSKCRFEEQACSGVKTFVSCVSCHSLYTIPDDNESRRLNSRCILKNVFQRLGVVF